MTEKGEEPKRTREFMGKLYYKWRGVFGFGVGAGWDEG